jgi:membrane-associated HD superfamily phosphohydrolase
MFSFFRTSARRQAIRDDLMESQEERSRWSPRVGVLLANSLVFFILAVVLSLFPSDKVTLQVGQTAAADITSPVPNSFILEDPVLTEKVRDEVRRQTWPVLVPQIATHELIRSQLQDLREDVVALPAGNIVPTTITNRWPGITTPAIAWLRTVDPETYTVKVRLFLTQLSKYPLVKANTLPAEQSTFYVASPDPLKRPTLTVERQNLILLSDAATAMPHLSALVSEAFPAVMHEAVAGYLQQLQQPTYAYDALQTKQLAAQRAAEVPNQGQPINKGEVLIKRGEVITQAALNRYHAVHREFERYRLNELPWAWWLGRLGQMPSS